MGYNGGMGTVTPQHTVNQPAGNWWRLFGLVTVFVAGCTSGPTPILTPTAPATGEIRDAIPKVEPRSKYGNPPFYDVNGHRYYTMTNSEGYVERGVASWYGPGFHGKRTSSGEPYDMNGMTAAHTTLPLPTYLYVINLSNKRAAVLRVNDRGPFEKNRLIDLSYAGAKRLGLDKPGTALVEIHALDPAAPATWPSGATALVAAARGEGSGTQVAAATTTTPTAAPAPRPDRPVTKADAKPPTIYVQVGAFADRTNAERLRRRLASAMSMTVSISTVQATQQTLYRVRLGPLDSVESADRLMDPLNQLGIHEPRIIVD